MGAVGTLVTGNMYWVSLMSLYSNSYMYWRLAQLIHKIVNQITLRTFLAAFVVALAAI